jgi:hypothetical protein
MKSKIFIIPFVVVTLLCFGCEWEDMAPDEALPDNVPVSFSKDVMPVFNKSCNTSSCHGAGANYPDLSANNAYTVLLGSDLIDTIAPENSELYLRMINTSRPMPPSGVLSKKETSFILNWIKQKAQNN